jgi:transcriptional regulator with XRE-family HTH domain
VAVFINGEKGVNSETGSQRRCRPLLDRYARLVSDRRTPPSLGEIIRKQRELAEMPIRQFAAMVGISGPYLSQIERGLRAPSEQVLGAIAKSLRTSAEALQDQAEALAPQQPAPAEVIAAINRDPDLTARQRQSLIEVYTALTEATLARRRRGRARDAAGPRTENGSGPGEG